MNEVKINSKKWFTGFCLLHIFLWTVIPTIFFKTVYMDTAESIAWGLQWQLGYSKHPPMSGWIAAVFAKLGPYVGLQMYLLGTIAVLITFWAIWRLANRILTPVQALFSILLIDCTLYYNCYAARIDPDTMQYPFWALVFLTFFVALKEEKIYQWVLTGFCCALALYTKYSAVLIFIPMVALILFTRDGRKQLLKPGIYVCFLIFLICISPHVIWSYNNGFQEISYVSGASGVTEQKQVTFIQSIFSCFNFIGAQIGFSILMYLLIGCFLFVKRNKKSHIKAFDKQFIYFMGFGPLVIALVYPIVCRNELMPRWGFPLFSLFGIIAMMWINPIVTKKAFRRFIILFFIIFSIVSISFSICYGYWFANVNGNYRSWSYFPGKNIADKVTEIWQNKYQTPLKYVAGSHYLVAYITAYSKDHPVPFFDWEESESKWIDVKKMKKDGAVFVWWTENSPQGMPSQRVFDEIKRRYPSLEKPEKLHFDKIGIPKDGKPILKDYLRTHYPELLAKPVIHQFFPDDSDTVDIGFAILPPQS